MSYEDTPEEEARCQICGDPITQGPTARDYERFQKRLCGGEDCSHPSNPRAHGGRAASDGQDRSDGAPVTDGGIPMDPICPRCDGKHGIEVSGDGYEWDCKACGQHLICAIGPDGGEMYPYHREDGSCGCDREPHTCDDAEDAHGLEVIPPHALPDQMRVCYRGRLTHEQAQTKLGSAYRVLELCPARCLSDDPQSNDLVEATEVIFAHAATGGTDGKG